MHRNNAEVLQKIVLERELGVDLKMDPVLSRDEFLKIAKLVRQVYLPEVVANYIARLVNATHPGESATSSETRFGASPRAALGFAAAVKARALFHCRINASFEDVKILAMPILQHRIILDYRAKVEGKSTATIIESLLQEVSTQERDIPSTLKEIK